MLPWFLSISEPPSLIWAPDNYPTWKRFFQSVSHLHSYSCSVAVTGRVSDDRPNTTDEETGTGSTPSCLRCPNRWWGRAWSRKSDSGPGFLTPRLDFLVSLSGATFRNPGLLPQEQSCASWRKLDQGISLGNSAEQLRLLPDVLASSLQAHWTTLHSLCYGASFMLHRDDSNDANSEGVG